MRALAGVCAIAAIGTLGCSFLLPTSREEPRVPWESYVQAKLAYDRIEVESTSLEELGRIGFDPDETPNVRSLDYLGLVRTLVPLGPLTVAELPASIQRCVAARETCRGVEIDLSVRKTKRLGFWFFDMFRFRRQVHTTGWDFGATVVFVDGIVVYKTWRGVPEIDEYSDRIQPLGPLQDPFELLIGIFGPG